MHMHIYIYMYVCMYMYNTYMRIIVHYMCYRYYSIQLEMRRPAQPEVRNPFGNDSAAAAEPAPRRPWKNPFEAD